MRLWLDSQLGKSMQAVSVSMSGGAGDVSCMLDVNR
jgi:hypothetical protein